MALLAAHILVFIGWLNPGYACQAIALHSINYCENSILKYASTDVSLHIKTC